MDLRAYIQDTLSKGKEISKPLQKILLDMSKTAVKAAPGAATGVSKMAYDTLSNPGATLSKQYIYNPENKRVAPFLPYEAAGIANDVGTGIRAGQSQGDMSTKERLARQLETQGYNTKDDALKSDALKAANMIRQQLSGEANDISQSFSPGVGDNPIMRGLQGGAEIGNTAAIVTSALNMANKAAGKYSGEAPKSGQVSAEDYKARLEAGRQASPYTQYEKALSAGDLKTAEAIAQQHPGDLHFQAHKIGQQVDDFLKTNQNLADPKEQMLRNMARDSQYNAEATGGRGGFLDLNARIGKGGDKLLADDLTQKAIKEYGTTKDPNLAAFLTKDGKMIDGSGLKQGSDGGARVVGHGEIANQVLDGDGFHNPSNSKLGDFISRSGSARMISDSDVLYIETARKLSSDQLKQIAKIQNGRPIAIDISNKYGGLDNSGEFKKIDDLVKFINKNLKK